MSDHDKKWVDPHKVKFPLQDEDIKYIGTKSEDGTYIIYIACNKFDDKGRGKIMCGRDRLFGYSSFWEHVENKYHRDAVQRKSDADKKISIFPQA